MKWKQRSQSAPERRCMWACCDPDPSWVSRGRSQKLCTLGWSWPTRFWQPGLCERSFSQRDTASPHQLPWASQLAGGHWTDLRFPAEEAGQKIWVVTWSLMVTKEMFSHPEETIQWSVLHKLCDDPLRRSPRDNPLQLQHIGMIKLSQDPRFTEKHALLSVRRPPAKSLHSHQHFPAAHRTVTSTRHFSKLGWMGTEPNQLAGAENFTGEI